MTDQTLATQQEGSFACHAIDTEGEAMIRLKRFGICEGRTIRVLRAGDPMIVFSAGAQFALSRQLAESVRVSRTDEQAEVNR